MKKHTKIYLDAMGYSTVDFIPCEICSAPGVDTHHIFARGMGGSKSRDTIENLMCLCRACHVKYGDIKEHREWLQDVHEKKMIARGVK